jgi:ATP-dependent DNA helicase RecG
MSATPIPRTLSLILYGDLDISIIDELPPGRVPVKTHIVPEEKRGGMYGFIRDQVAEGRQAYIVCPLVEESEAIEARPAEMVYEELREGPLKGLRLGLAHGKMKSAELAEALERFAAGETDVLVATTVIEVGVNVPNATVMVIENAERFGLAQLHQLRGRVGRADHTSWCFLMAQSNERLDLLTRTGDGFVIAQRDMELRGVGEILGTRQSGAMLQGIGMSGMDTRLLKEAHDEARELMSQNTEEALLMEALAKERFGDEILDAALN